MENWQEEIKFGDFFLNQDQITPFDSVCNHTFFGRLSKYTVHSTTEMGVNMTQKFESDLSQLLFLKGNFKSQFILRHG